MKTNFTTLALVGLAIVLASCNKSNESTGGTQFTNVTVKIVAPSTYASGPTAVGLTPDIYDATLYFLGSSGSILAVGTMTEAEVTSGKTFNDIPGDAAEILFIGNAGALSSPNLPTVLRVAESTLTSTTFWEQAVQTNPKTGVNVIGEGTIMGSAGNRTATVTALPAVSRIEIAQVEANPAATIPLTSFKLTGIYINNAYAELGLDYTTLPAAGDILNYGSDDPIWNTGYPPTFCELMPGAIAGTTFNPGAGDVWSFFALPVVAGNGTIIDGAVQTSVPHIILKIEGATASGFTLPDPAYLTIKDFKRGASDVTELLKGKVFSISTIAFGGEHLTAKPEISTRENVAVTVTVTPWTNDPVTPDL